MTQINEILKNYYGYDSFRPGQKEIIYNIMRGRDVCAIMPTGAGKSLCYQIPAIAMKGITLVISPLISLMQDQVRILKSVGVPAAYINSSLTPRQTELALSRAMMGMYKLIYVAPERLLTKNFLSFAVNADISLVAVDESHCISMWGQEFRPSYRKISDFTHQLKKRPVVAAFTATADSTVKNDIINKLELVSPYCLTTSFDRPNLYFGTLSFDSGGTSLDDSRIKYITDYVCEHKDESGIVYCLTKKDTELAAQILRDNGCRARAYHAGMPSEERRIIQEDFTFGRTKVIAATSAFGMGIDKPDVRYVLHYGMPARIEDYYQQAGRAGRDGEPSECILLYSYRDYYIIKEYFILRERGDDEKKQDGLTDEEREEYICAQLEALDKMKNYAVSKRVCLRRQLVEYFGEKIGSTCKNCSVCLGDINRRSGNQEKLKLSEYDEELYIRLKAKAKVLSIRYGIPVFAVADDKTIMELVREKPQNETQLRRINGFGTVKIRQYGSDFLDVIRDYTKTKQNK